MCCFNKQLFKKQIKAVAVSTDLEPDDIVALFFLVRGMQRNASGLLPILIVVGEGKVEKATMMRSFAQNLSLECTVVQGSLSQRNYPSEMLNLFSTNAPNDASKVISSALSARTETVKTDYDKECKKAMEQFLETYEHVLFLMIKPCWELFGISPNLLKKISLACYGSFNFRCLFEKIDRSVLATFFNTAFDSVVLYETFFVMGDDNSINAINAPRFYDSIRRRAAVGDPIFVNLSKSIAVWNNHIVTEQLKSVQKISKAMFEAWEDEEKQIIVATSTGESDQIWKKRKASVDKILQGSAKIVNSVVVAKGQQMVFADFGLFILMLEQFANIMTLDSLVQCSISFDQGRGNTLITPDSVGSVFVIKNVDKAKLIEACEIALETM